ncbi:hypothetical protein [Prochlorothrix hollandica]|nr:hypothetical protein [Prochlorothrix hollandica]
MSTDRLPGLEEGGCPSLPAAIDPHRCSRLLPPNRVMFPSSLPHG